MNYSILNKLNISKSHPYYFCKIPAKIPLPFELFRESFHLSNSTQPVPKIFWESLLSEKNIKYFEEQITYWKDYRWNKKRFNFKIELITDENDKEYIMGKAHKNGVKSIYESRRYSIPIITLSKDVAIISYHSYVGPLAAYSVTIICVKRNGNWVEYARGEEVIS